VLISSDGVVPSRMVGVYLPLYHKVHNKISSGSGYPGSPGKRVRKRLCVCMCDRLLFLKLVQPYYLSLFCCNTVIISSVPRHSVMSLTSLLLLLL